jgi:NAD(P)H-dependent FMN reductase
MSESPLHVAVIVGSTREGRFGETVARWFAGQARRRSDMLVDVVDLAEIDLPPVLANQASPAVQAYAERIERADAFVVVTPEYNHGYPASLKQAIDLLHAPWQRKPVGFVAYGGLSGGLRAVEQLRQVFAELHATTLRDSVSFHRAWTLFDEAGDLLDPGTAVAATETMLDELAWWGRALRSARAASLVDAAWQE